MVTNSNTKQLPYLVNTFSKGMDTDTSDALISNDAYRIAKNLRYITDIDETTGELRLIEGVTEIESGDSNIESLYTIRAFCSIRNVGALICENNSRQWAVFRVEFNNDQYTATRIFGWCSEELGLSTKVSTVLKHEDADQDDTKIQLYIADGKHQIMKINLYDTTESTDIKYVSNGIVFSGLNKINITDILPSGRLEAGLVLYTYRLYNKNNVATQIAPLSEIKAITKAYTTIGPIGLHEQEMSSIGLRIKIRVDDNTYPKIQIYRILYLVNGQLPKISLICDLSITLDNNDFIYDDLGGSSLQELTQEEFNSLSGIYIQPKVIELKNGILFAGNIKYDVDVLDETYLNMDFRAFSSGDGVTSGDWPSIDENKENPNLYFNKTYNESYWHTIKPGSTNTIGGYGPNIEWRFGTNEELEEDIVINKLPLNMAPGVEKLLVENDREKYNNAVLRGLRHDEVYRYGIILYSKNGTKYPVKWIADIRTPNINGQLDASEESGNEATSLSHIYYDQSSNIAKEVSHILFPIFTLHPNPAIDSNVISGYEIVRVHRTIDDMATITQGIISSTVEKNDNKKEVSSSGMPFLDRVRYVDNYGLGGAIDLANYTTETNINVLLFYSPEISYLPDDTILILNANNDLYLLCLYPISTTKLIEGDIRTIPDLTTKLGNITITNVNNLAQNMYYGNSTSYMLGYGLYSTQDGDYEIKRRIKWYHYKLAGFHFLNNPETLPVDDMFTTFLGLNVYKLHRSRSGMPEEIINWSSTDYGTISPTYKYDIHDYALVNHIDYNKLVSNDSFHGKDYQSVVGDYTFFNCVAPFIFADSEGDFNINKIKTDAGENKYRNELIATCDPSLAIAFDKSGIYNIVNHFYRDEYLCNLPTRGDTLHDCEYSMLCNIRRNIIPYGGFSKYSRDHSTYTQHGYYFDANYTEPIKMFDGDTTVSTFEFVTAHKWYDATHVSARATIVCQVAVESSIDINLDAGDKFSNNTSSNPSLVQVNPCNFNDEYIQKNQSYVYNTAYSIDPLLLLVNYSLDQIENSLKNLDYRVHYSNKADNDLASDPWLIFLPLNYLDVDSKYGPITELRTFKNELLFWQERAMGVLSVNERVLIATESNLPLILGTGGVLERYDYLTTNNGMKENLHADTQSDSTLYWWDYDNNTICAYTRGNIPVQLSKVKSVQNILNKSAKDNKLLLSSITRGHYPLLIHDNKYDEILFKVGVLGDTTSINTLVYSERQGQFSSIYDIDPMCYFDIDRVLYFLNKNEDTYKMYRWNDGNGTESRGFDLSLLPYIKYIINDQGTQVKVYDNAEFAGTIPDSYNGNTLTEDINFLFNTPLKQVGKIDGTKITNRQLDFKFAIPRCGYEDEQTGEWVTKEWGDRMRGKTMQCEMSSLSNSLNFSLQYIITKYRISWS